MVLMLILYLPSVYGSESCENPAKVGDRVGIKSQVSNPGRVEQRFAYIVQIKDSNEVTIQLSWLTGVLKPEQKMDVIQSWIPEVIGQYTAEVFLWQSQDNPNALGPIKTLAINVNC
jgi:hypothetical protein